MKRRTIRLRLRTETGQAAVVVALGMLGLLAMVGLVMDGGNAFIERRRMQNAADAAALAGAAAMNVPGATEASIASQINAFAEQNGVSDTNGMVGDATDTNVDAYFIKDDETPVGSRIGTNGGIPATATGVQVETHRQIDTYFAKVVNVNTVNAGARARAFARGGFRGRYNDLFPVAAYCADPYATSPACFRTGVEITLFDTVMLAPGNFGWVDFDGGANADSQLVQWIQSDCPDYLDIPGWYHGDTGTRGSSTLNALTLRVGDLIKVPVYRNVNPRGGSNFEYEFVGVAEFTLTGFWYGAQNNRHAPSTAAPCSADVSQNCIRATFVSWLMTPSIS